jgi:pyruvate/2-oxoglutarate dehydrogenase complex dihydrolipoamide dehydrogenase (E3) component
VAPDQQLVPFSLFTDPELPRVGLSEKEAKAQGIAYRLFKIPMEAAMRASTMSEKVGKSLGEPPALMNARRKSCRR